MGTRGGYRPNAGRKKGSVASHRKLAGEATARSVGDGITPLEYLLNVMRDETADTKRRDDAAKAAAPFLHARLSAVAVTDNSPNRTVREMSDAELYALLAQCDEQATDADGTPVN